MRLKRYLRHLIAHAPSASYPLLQEGLVYRCPLNLRKRLNLAAQVINRPLLSKREIALPHILHVGVTTYCNLRCPACPTGTRALGRAREHLAFDTYARAVDELRGSLLLMLFWDWGEPLLHPQIDRMIAHAGRSRIKTVISSNGTIASPKRLERLVASKPTVIIICVDGATQESYEAYRIGGRLTAVLKTLERLAELKTRMGTPYPVVEFRTLATRYSEPEMPTLLEMAQKVGANLFSVKTLRPYDYRGHDVDRELVPLDPALARYQYDEARPDAEHRVYDNGPLSCGKPLYAPTLDSDGRLSFCSYARHPEELFGSLAERGVVDLWRSSQARHKRIHFLARRGTRSCDRCYFRTTPKPTVATTVALTPLPSGVSVDSPLSPEGFLQRVWEGRSGEGALEAVPARAAR